VHELLTMAGAELSIIDGELPEELSWQERALCARPIRRRSPEKGGSTREAKRVCMACEVRAECLDYALAHDERFGIWAGLSNGTPAREEAGRLSAPAVRARWWTGRPGCRGAARGRLRAGSPGACGARTAAGPADASRGMTRSRWSRRGPVPLGGRPPARQLPRSSGGTRRGAPTVRPAAAGIPGPLSRPSWCVTTENPSSPGRWPRSARRPARRPAGRRGRRLRRPRCDLLAAATRWCCDCRTPPPSATPWTPPWRPSRQARCGRRRIHGSRCRTRFRRRTGAGLAVAAARRRGGRP